MGTTVLIADDDSFINQMVGSYLNKKGYETVWAKDGQEGYEMFMDHLPDMVLVDVLMPNLNGPDMVKKIRGREQGKDVPIVIMTSIEKTFKFERDVKHKWGADALLKKPFEFPALLKLVEKYIGPGDFQEDKKSNKGRRSKKILKGTFTDRSYGKLLHKLYKNKSSGKLELESDRKRIAVYIQSGIPVDVKSNYIQEGSLIRILESIVKIDSHKIDMAHKLMDSSGLREGEALVEIGAITREDLARALRKQVKQKLLTPFVWTDAAYVFTDGMMIQDPDLLLNIPLPQVVLNGISEHYTLERLIASFEGKEDRYFEFNAKTPYQFKDFGLDPDEKSILNLAKSGENISQILRHSTVGKRRTYQLLYVAFLLGIFKFNNVAKSYRPEQPEQPVESEEPSMKLAEYDENFSDEQAEMFFAQGQSYLEKSDFASAATSFEKAININNRDSRYFALMALAIQKMPQGDSEQYADPNSLLKRAIKMNSHCTETKFVLGLLCKEQKKYKRARLLFEEVLELDSNHARAKRELLIVKMKLRKIAGNA